MSDWIRQVDANNKESQKYIGIIQRFDEVLWEKASKIWVNDVAKQFEDYISVEEFNIFQQMRNDTDKKFQAKLNNFDKKIEDLNTSTKQIIANSVIKISKEAKDQLINTLGGRPVEPEELRALLKLKADKDDMHTLDFTKANRADIETTTSVLDILHSQMNHIWVILKSYFSFQTESMKKEESKGRKKIE